MQPEERHQPSVTKAYEAPGIRIHWEPRLCIHVANCIRHLPGVFDPQARPWIAPGATPADELARAVEACPTGALTYERTDGAPGEAPENPPVVQPRPNGPLFLRGRFDVVDTGRSVQRTATRMALCRCGQSGNKPYCDATHRSIGFRTED